VKFEAKIKIERTIHVEGNDIAQVETAVRGMMSTHNEPGMLHSIVQIDPPLPAEDPEDQRLGKDWISKLYFESHITIDPVFDQERETVSKMAQAAGFRLAKLIMRKSTRDAEQPSQDDTFMTSHSRSYADIESRTVALVQGLQNEGYTVRRYKIENTILDSRHNDEHRLLA
jgi:hypothetical protein